MYISFAGLLVLISGIALLYWTLRHFNSEIHKQKDYIKDSTYDSFGQVLMIFFANILLRLLPAKLMKVVLIIVSICVLFFSVFIFSLLF
nr:hypothetical protein [Lysinibacillus timonensis]